MKSSFDCPHNVWVKMVKNVLCVLGITTRNAEIPRYTHAFLVAGVATILLTRLYLRLMHFPKIGGDSGLHVAHALFGGAILSICLLLLLTFLGEQARLVISAVGGVGFGLFVDELGKYITADYNYFFRPTVALIYVLFVLLYLWLHAMILGRLSRAEYLANAVQALEDMTIRGTTQHDVARALDYLEGGGAQGSLKQGLQEAVSSIASGRVVVRSPVARFSDWSWSLYDRLGKSSAFGSLTRAITLGRGAAGIAFALAVGAVPLAGTALPESRLDLDRAAALVGATTQVLVMLVIAWGAITLHRSRLDGYAWLERALLLSIFFGQFYLFWLAELAATSLLIVDLVLFAAIHELVHHQAARLRSVGVVPGRRGM